MWVINWLRDLYGLLQFAFPRRGKDGKISGFLYTSDDPSIPDYHADGVPFGRRIFVSFARGSLPLAERFENAFRKVGLVPWRYKPEEISEDTELAPRGIGNLVEQGRYLRKHYPETLRLLPATLRRCSAVLFLVSEESLKSALCELEAFTAGTIYTFGGRPAANSAVYVILEEPELAPSPWLSGFWRRTYEEGLEEALAAVITTEIDSQATILRLSEQYRQQRYR